MSCVVDVARCLSCVSLSLLCSDRSKSRQSSRENQRARGWPHCVCGEGGGRYGWGSCGDMGEGERCVCKYVCVLVHHTYVRTVAVTFLVNMQTYTLAPRINPQYTSVPPNPSSTGGAGAKLPAGRPAERSASCAPSVMQAPSARRDGRLAS